MNLEGIQAKILALPDTVRSNPEHSFSAIIELYENTRIQGASLENDGDMLLFQWGTYDWGQGASFELDLTRQIIPDDEEAPPILQLQCTYRYAPDPFSDIVAGNQWCHQPNEIAEFKAFVLGSAALRRATGLPHATLIILLQGAE